MKPSLQFLLPIVWIMLVTPAAAADGEKAPAPQTGAAPALSALALQKLDPQLLLALKKMRGQPPFDQPTKVVPDIPITDGTRALIDVEVTSVEALLKHLPTIGAAVAQSPDSTRIVRAMIPLDQLEALVARGDVKSLVPAKLSVIRGIKLAPTPAAPEAAKASR